MPQAVLLDTNLLIAALDRSNSTAEDKQAQAKEKLNELLRDETIAVAITPLIRYEVLRGIGWQENERYDELQDLLGDFEEFDIDREVSELAANLYRFDVEQSKTNNIPRNFEKRKFDMFHFASAVCNDLELTSQDSDIAKLKTLYTEYQSHA